MDRGMASWQLRLAQWLETWEWVDGNITDDCKLTWIELLIAFEIGTNPTVPGNQIQTTSDCSALKPKMSIGQLASHFKKLTMELIENHFTVDVGKFLNTTSPGTLIEPKG